jgi:hypothetical protein
MAVNSRHSEQRMQVASGQDLAAIAEFGEIRIEPGEKSIYRHIVIREYVIERLVPTPVYIRS